MSFLKYRTSPTNPFAVLIDTTVLQQRRKAGKYRAGKGTFPFPVYVARFADGREQRVSFWSPDKGQIDFAHGFNVSLVLGRAAPVAGHVEHNGAVIPDPHFTPAIATPEKVRKESPASRLAAICRALNEGEIEAACRMAAHA